MNEVTHIHLGRQPYTISKDAHQELKGYLVDIEKKLGDKEVVNEVELRMSELLSERGVTGDKVILPADVKYLIGQLGSPADFSDDGEAAEILPTGQASKRLFRDTDNALLAGVAAGIANYTGLEVVLVRLLFLVVTVLSAGLGIVLYILLWLVVPAAESTSEKLQMRGKPVTLEALKDSVGNADVSGAVRRVNSSAAAIINAIFRISIKLVGIGFILTGLGMFFGIAVTKIYMLLHNGRLFQENIFPVGAREEWLLALVMSLVIIAAIFLLLTGVATLKRKWPIGGWLTGLLAGVLLINLAVGVALAADAAPRIRDRYETSLHTTAVKNIQPFNSVSTTGDIDIAYISSPNYSVNVHYVDRPDLSKLNIQVKNNTLYIDSTKLDAINHCTMLCLFPRYNMTVQIYAPNIEQFKTPPGSDIFFPSPAS